MSENVSREDSIRNSDILTVHRPRSAALEAPLQHARQRRTLRCRGSARAGPQVPHRHTSNAPPTLECRKGARDGFVITCFQRHDARPSLEKAPHTQIHRRHTDTNTVTDTDTDSHMHKATSSLDKAPTHTQTLRHTETNTDTDNVTVTGTYTKRHCR
jgi:hypothetical protein